MKKILILTVILITIAASASAFFPRGTINKNYSYDNLEFNVTKEGKCYLQGTIINETNIRREDVSITFYAMTIHDKTLWKKKIRIDIIDSYGKFEFNERIKRCNKEEPYKWEFKIKDRNK